MGLSIHYTFRMRDMAQIPNLVEEVKDICESLNWKYHLWDTTEPVEAKYLPSENITNNEVRLQGILFSPPECEPLFLTFTPMGWTSSFLAMSAAEGLFEIGPRYLYCISTKTQYAGEAVHIAVIKLFKYLEKKYFDAAHTYFDDEGEYWETLDKNILHQVFERYKAAMNFVAEALENAEWTASDDPENVAAQVEAILRRKLGEGGDVSTPSV